MEFNATFIVSAISFGIFVIIMNAIFYKPLQKIVSERQKFIDDTYEEAKTHLAKSEAIMKDRQKKLDTTKHEAKKLITDKTEEAKSQKSDLTSEAHKKAVSKVEDAKMDLQKSKDEAESVLSEEIKKIALDISYKILGKEKV